jgi:hypothetical protein
LHQADHVAVLVGDYTKYIAELDGALAKKEDELEEADVEKRRLEAENYELLNGVTGQQRPCFEVSRDVKVCEVNLYEPRVVMTVLSV